jgi:hypothetical protein
VLLEISVPYVLPEQVALTGQMVAGGDELMNECYSYTRKGKIVKKPIGDTVKVTDTAV